MVEPGPPLLGYLDRVARSKLFVLPNGDRAAPFAGKVIPDHFTLVAHDHGNRTDLTSRGVFQLFQRPKHIV